MKNHVFKILLLSFVTLFGLVGCGGGGGGTTDPDTSATDPDISLEAFFVGKTRYFANSRGGTGERSYANDGSYIGSVTLADSTTFDVSGTYEIEGNVLTITRTSPSATTLVLTYLGQEEGGWDFAITINGGEAFETHEFQSVEDRDAYAASL